MKVMIYSTTKNKWIKTFEKRIRFDLPAIEIRQVGSMGVLSQAISRPLNHIAVIVLLDAREQEITQLLKLKLILNDIRLIFVIPEKDYSSLQPLALQINPSFIGRPEGLDDVLIVLKNIVRRALHRNRGYFAAGKF